ncbi:pentapeptide repeat-containing protein [Schinkia azotoformans]|uniref:pentapeptide repeat-containing protein n=1 Tax=Schinkia azotoformans TaxID=1454 RepID=UPI002E1D0171|nr:pentapeptide repeat-containing protein [Schinkia azotoformans]
MNREEALEHFKEHEVKQRQLASLLALEAFFQTNKDRLAEDFQRSFQTICRLISEQQLVGEKKRIGHLSFSMLRTELLVGRPFYLIEATDEEWIFDEEPYLASYDASWAFSFLNEMISELTERAKTYMGTITLPDIDRIKLEEAANFHQYVVSLARYALPWAVNCKEYIELEKEEELEIRIGEYFDCSEVVYKEDQTEKDSAEIKEWLEEKLEDEYPYEVFANLQLSEGNYEETDLRYTDFRKSDLSQSSLNGCLLIGANLTGSNLTNSDLSNSFIHEANFSGSVLRQANFSEIEGASGLVDSSTWEMPGYLPVLFEGADLEGANFEGADVRGASFLGASLQNVNFSGANLDGAIFSKDAKGILRLNAQQQSSVIWK